MNKTTRKTLQIYWNHVRRYNPAMAVLALSLIASVAGDVWRPFFYKDLFDALHEGPSHADQAVKAIGSILAVAVVSWVFWRISTFTNNFFQPRVMSDLLNTCFQNLHHHSYNFFNNNFVGTLVRRANRYVRSFEDIADIFYWHLGQTTLRLIFILGVLVVYHRTLALVVALWSIGYIAINYWFAKFKLPYDIRQADADTAVFGYLADTVTNNINLKLFGGFQKEYRKFMALTQRLFALKRHSWDLSAISETIQAGLMIALEITVLMLAVRYWRAGRLTVGDFALIQTYLIQIFERLWDVGRYIRQIYERLADAEGMTTILTTPHEIKDAPHAKKMRVTNGTIEYRDITFGYRREKPIFKHFNITIAAGERLALIGPSGGGKSTCVKLLFRFLDLQKGAIVIDGQDIATVTQESLRSNISLVPQDPILFHRTLYENISYTKPDASRHDVIRAAKLAHCHEFIAQFPDQYETYVGERGIKLSGGERQRVAIARAILKNAPILVLDEATSSLDSESESLIQDALKNLMQGKTTMVIAHRLSTIMQMDRILVLEGGKIVEEGTHHELLKVEEGRYQRLWHIQAGGFVGHATAN